jgi:AcrR family transcriptional regulator
MSISTLQAKPLRAGSYQSSPGGRALQKGQQTKQAIVDAALGLAAQIGLEGLSIGALAEVTQMSKSGVFAHFGSREELQISVIREYYARFSDEVFFPAMDEGRGLPRVRALFANWMKRVAVEIQSGCIFISGAVEFDDRPGPVRDALASSVKTWLSAMYRAVVQAKAEGQLNADADEEQMAFEIHGLILALHYEARFLKNPGAIKHANQGFENILARYGKSVAAKSARSPKSIQSSKE